MLSLHRKLKICLWDSLIKNLRKIAACLVTSMNQMRGASTYRIMIPTIPTFGIGDN